MSDDLRFQMMGMGGPAPSASPAAAAKSSSGADTGYPTLYGIIGEKPKADAFLATLAATKAKLDAIAKGTDAKAKSEARKALIALDHAGAFVKTGAELVQQKLKEMQARAKPKAGAKK